MSNGIKRLQTPVSILSYASVVGKKEGEGPMNSYFDKIFDDSYLGEDTWEKAESKLQQTAVLTALEKADLSPENIDLIFAGDLINQCTSSTFGLRPLEIPFLGIYGACSTMAEGLITGSIAMSAGVGDKIVAATSSHFSTAERQFRFPLSYGGQRTPTSQWTCTASGAVVLTKDVQFPQVTGFCIGKITDLGVTDANNMGAAMAPAAADTLVRWFNETGNKPEQYDAIVTGDLGIIGSELFCDLVMKQGYDVTSVHKDCGVMIFDPETQDTHAGGSGCGCSASILCGYFLPKLRAGELCRILFLATGALMSPTLTQQGESIPSISHLVELIGAVNKT